MMIFKKKQETDTIYFNLDENEVICKDENNNKTKIKEKNHNKDIFKIIYVGIFLLLFILSFTLIKGIAKNDNKTQETINKEEPSIDVKSNLFDTFGEELVNPGIKEYSKDEETVIGSVVETSVDVLLNNYNQKIDEIYVIYNEEVNKYLSYTSPQEVLKTTISKLKTSLESNLVEMKQIEYRVSSDSELVNHYNAVYSRYSNLYNSILEIEKASYDTEIKEIISDNQEVDNKFKSYL